MHVRNKEFETKEESFLGAMRNIFLNLDADVVRMTFPGMTYCEEHDAFWWLNSFQEEIDDKTHPRLKCKQCFEDTVHRFTPVMDEQQLPCVSQARLNWLESKKMTIQKGQERAAFQIRRSHWMIYFQSAWQVGVHRRHRILQWQKQEQQEEPGGDANQYDADLKMFREDFMQSSGSYQTMNRNQNDVAVLFCDMHDKRGDIVPFRPFLLYQEGCGICVKAKNPKKVHADCNTMHVDERELFRNPKPASRVPVEKA